MTAVSERGYNGGMAVRGILWGLITLCGLSILPELSADIPWPEVKRRLAQENGKLARRPQGHNGEFFVVCTLYYTPMESGVTRERGFDVTPETKPGLRGRKYPRAFLEAVKREGSGQIITPVNGHNYIRYRGGNSFGFAAHPTGRGGDLVPRSSAAARGSYFPLGTTLVTSTDTVRQALGSANWKIIDSGHGLVVWQIDLYWGDDEPLGPGKLLARPRGTTFEYAYSEAKITK